MFKPFTRISFVFVIFIIISLIFIARLFQLQILDYEKYSLMAKKQHWGGFVIPAKRGKIIIKDRYSNEEIIVATNNVKEVLFIDPVLATKENKIEDVVDFIAPIIFDEIYNQNIQRLEKEKILNVSPEKNTNENNTGNIITNDFIPMSSLTLEDYKTKSKTELLINYKKELKFNIKEKAQKNIKYMILLKNMPENISIKIKEVLNNEGIKQILKSIGIQSEYIRNYPEKTLMASLIGFVNKNGYGQYGIEEQYDSILRGIDGMVIAEQDQRGRQLSLGNNQIIKPKDGADIYLTIDRALQQNTQNILDKYKKEMDADAIHAIIMEVPTGKILTMASSPSFDPNNYSDVYDIEEINTDINVYKSNLKAVNKNYPIININNKYFKYKNNLGPYVYINHNISSLYEPGSIFKPLIMAAGIDAKEITPYTRCNICGGPYKVDEYIITTWNNKYYPNQTMHEVLERSDNVGMVFIQKKLGKSLMYKYIKDFGFGMLTDIGFDVEKTGVLRHFRSWSNAEAATLSFGQGISVTPIQMITAINAIANDGNLMRPYVVEKIIKDGKIFEAKYPQTVRKVISSKTAETMKAMMIGVVEKEAGKLARIDGYLIAGKTGTAQIAKGGGYEKGKGSTIASFVGFLPADNPTFTILVKVDRPRKTPWGSEAAAPIFKEIAEFALQYYQIPKSKKNK